MNHIDVSVVVPCYNSNQTLERCLISAADQVPPPREIIVVDDGSDETPTEIVERVSNSFQIDIKLVSQPNFGAPSARNRGLFLARSKYVAFLDSDDVWLSGKLSVQFNAMESRGWLISGHGYNFDLSRITDRNAIGKRSLGRLTEFGRWKFVFGNPYFTPTVMVLREKFQGFDQSFRRVDDYKAWVQFFEATRYGFIDDVLASGFKRPIGQSGLTGSLDAMHKDFLLVLRCLYSEGSIGFLFFSMASIVEILKFPLRIFFTWIFRLRSSMFYWR